MTANNSKPALMEVEEVTSSGESAAEAKDDKKDKPVTGAAAVSEDKDAKKDAAASSADAAIPTPAAEDDLGKVQELLFGNQLRAINQKIMLVHKDFKQSMSDLDRKLESQLRDQESMLKKELANVVEQLRAETKARESAIENSGVELRKSSNNLQDRISAVEKTHSAAKASMEDKLSQTGRELERQLQEARTDLQSQLDGARTTLDDNKVDRAALSELLGGIAQQISSIDKIPTVTQRTDAANTAASGSPDAKSA